MNQRAGGVDTLEQTSKAIHIIKRHRKQRHVRLREMTRDDDDENTRSPWTANGRGEISCPVCLQTVGGDQDVMEAHVDACLAHQHLRANQESQGASQEDTWEDIDVEGETRLRITNGTNLRGVLFCTTMWLCHLREHSDGIPCTK